MKKTIMLCCAMILFAASCAFAAEMRFASLRIRMDVPDGWQASENRSSNGSKVIVVSPDGNSLVSISKIPLQEGADPVEHLMNMTMEGSDVLNIERLDAEHYAYNVEIDGNVIMCRVAVKPLKKDVLVVNTVGDDPMLSSIVAGIRAFM